MIRVLHVLGSLNIGGSQMMVLNLYRSVDREKIQFDIIINRPNDLQLAKDFERLGSRIFLLPSFNGRNIGQVKKAWNSFFSEHPEYKILHSHVRSYASLYIPIAKKHGVKTIIHSHSTNEGSGISKLVKRMMEFPLRYQADYLFACSKESGEWLFGKKACEKKNYYFFPNGIDLSAYVYNQQIREDYRRIFNVENKFVIGHVGRFHEAKNHLFLLEVFAKVHKKRPESVLMLVGDGDCSEQIQNKIEELGISQAVILTGSRSDVPQLLQAMDIFVLPSLWEGLPVTVVEAQAAGLPCLISDRITLDVDITDLVKRLAINDQNVWVETLLKATKLRKNCSNQIIEANFDINGLARWLTDFYFGLYGE